MEFCADFHIHSKYSRATSKEMVIEKIAESARKKGIALVGTSDFTHPAWFAELKEQLTPLDNGLFKHRDTQFILSTEVNNTYVKGGKLRRIHNVIFAPSFEKAHLIGKALANFGKVASDGRPTLSLDSGEMVELVLDCSPESLVIPAHVWTPHFSLFGAFSGFDSIDDCFGSQVESIFCVETGLSSDPAMNWRLSALDRFTLISNSDAHSPSKLGREANFFSCELSYYEIVDVLKSGDPKRFRFTVEFFPEEGKYHYDGHRKCGMRMSPAESRARMNTCPVCGKRLTIGVMHRVEELGDREDGFRPPGAIPYKRLIPLDEIIADALAVGVDTQAVRSEYERLVSSFGSEFEVLLKTPVEELSRISSSRIAEAVVRVREGKVKVLPGYDGVFGEIRIFEEEEVKEDQMTLF